ncbi:BZ3500_MvSof-1268-A1-R1_Chr1-3g01903 [Microbotryum saponariae]|uniref:BZ3500_MvSof-1268-A1-R1_Chr1-3g01903 protein n=1 Tax=Microbotryum saponariae TaxID=289078 RepID=A0A2X0KRN1_9BASI|nr:BZ3500_MvSof-1268-A1-R1_Chr1-3g01903 [Microbotryum saponariae]SCZ94858.1 BZ3501_MvSof-1269-A2-R1_Chr1-3g01505 [Microbotryum saponariae]
MNFIRSLLNGWMPQTTEQDLAQAKSTVEYLISSAPIAIFSKSYCPYCVNAKSLLAKLGQKGNTKSIELDHENNGVAIQRYLAERNHVSRVTIYIKGQLIGGCSDLQSLHSGGKLEPLLKAL